MESLEASEQDEEVTSEYEMPAEVSWDDMARLVTAGRRAEFESVFRRAT